MRAECSGSLSLRSEESRPSKPCKSLLPPEVKTIKRKPLLVCVCVCGVRVLGRGRKNEIEEERKDSIQLDRRSILLPAIRILEKQSLTYCEGRSRVASTIIPGKSRTNDNKKKSIGSKLPQITFACSSVGICPDRFSKYSFECANNIYNKYTFK